MMLVLEHPIIQGVSAVGPKGRHINLDNTENEGALAHADTCKKNIPLPRPYAFVLHTMNRSWIIALCLSTDLTVFLVRITTRAS